MTVSPETLRATLLALLAQRDPDKTICPSEVARALSSEDWRELMPAVRAIGVKLAAEGQIVVRQRGQVIDPKTARGPIRYGLAKASGRQLGDQRSVSGRDG